MPVTTAEQAIEVLTHYWIEDSRDPLGIIRCGCGCGDKLMVETGATVIEVGKLHGGWTIGEAAAMAIGWHNAIIRDYGHIEYPPRPEL